MTYTVLTLAVKIHVFEEFYVHKSRCFVIDYVYKCEFTHNYVTSFVPVGHMQGGAMTWLMFLTMCL